MKLINLMNVNQPNQFPHVVWNKIQLIAKTKVCRPGEDAVTKRGGYGDTAQPISWCEYL